LTKLTGSGRPWHTSGGDREQIVRSKATRVLIIDDDPLIRTLLVSALRKECFVAVAADGAEGFSKALELRPDVAVIDVNMPGWDGLKTLDAFRGHTNLRDIKIIMLTADASKQTVMAAVRGGANDYLIKTSFSKTDFYRKLNHLVPGTIRESPLLNEPRASEVGPAADVSGNTRDQSRPKAGDATVNGSRRQDSARAGTPEAALRVTSQPDSAHDSQLQVMIDGWE
jgi:CheY-like chemotaxis protein